MKIPTKDGLKEVSKEDIETFCKENPAVVVITGLLCLTILSQERSRPEWLNDCAPVHGRRNGAWRGKGSFGKTGLGVSKVHHK
jgi:hypothetical protein